MRHIRTYNLSITIFLACQQQDHTIPSVEAARGIIRVALRHERNHLLAVMPALTIFRKFDTSPFARDDLHILIAILGVFRLLQFVCLVAASVKFWWAQLNGVYVLVNGYAPWCLNYTPIDFSGDIQEILIFRENNIEPITERTLGVWLGCAVIYFCVDVAWMCFLWTASSIGTITEPRNRDKFVRRLILVKIFALSLFPLLLLVGGIVRIHIARRDNFGCPEGVDYKHQNLNPWSHAIFIVLMCTYAIELLFWPVVIVNVLVQQLKKTGRLIDGLCASTCRKT